MEKDLIDSFRSLLKKCKNKDYKLRALISKIGNYTEYLIDAKTENIIAIDIPENYLKNNKVFHSTITIETVEPYKGCSIDRNNLRFKSLWIGETCDFTVELRSMKVSSLYYELIPPNNTRISKVQRIEDTRKCNIMMEDIYSKKKGDKVRFQDEFDSRFIVHQSRKIDKKPLFSLRFTPYKMIQRWIAISLILCLLYEIALSGLLILYFLPKIEMNLLLFKDIAKNQGLWIFGLLIGNNLWMQKPRFLWKKVIYFSVIILIIGVFLNTFYILLISLLYPSV